jgi:predicted regulator of Ras-like GTPase activity (Roadblock/LC7/MglB family)
MESSLKEYLEYLCSENDDLMGLIVASNEGMPIAIASSNNTSNQADQTLISGMCTALKCIGKEFVQETMKTDLKRILVDCTEGVILIQPFLNQEAILVASSKNAKALRTLDLSSIQAHYSDHQNHLIAL